MPQTSIISPAFSLSLSKISVKQKKRKAQLYEVERKRLIRTEEQKVIQPKVNTQIQPSAQQLHLNLPEVRSHSQHMGSTTKPTCNFKMELRVNM